MTTGLAVFLVFVGIGFIAGTLASLPGRLGIDIGVFFFANAIALTFLVLEHGWFP
jgi:hypothetical protein